MSYVRLSGYATGLGFVMLPTDAAAAEQAAVADEIVAKARAIGVGIMENPNSHMWGRPISAAPGAPLFAPFGALAKFKAAFVTSLPAVVDQGVIDKGAELPSDDDKGVLAPNEAKASVAPALTDNTGVFAPNQTPVQGQVQSKVAADEVEIVAGEPVITTGEPKKGSGLLLAAGAVAAYLFLRK